jgi:hypothetical protein
MPLRLQMLLLVEWQQVTERHCRGSYLLLKCSEISNEVWGSLTLLE